MKKHILIMVSLALLTLGSAGFAGATTLHTGQTAVLHFTIPSSFDSDFTALLDILATTPGGGATVKVEGTTVGTPCGIRNSGNHLI